jgi:hypothetical protein
MTDRRSRLRGLLTVATSALAGFLVVAAVLAIQLRMGGDPALGSQPRASAAAAPRRVLIRRIEERRVIVRVVPAPVRATAAGPGARPLRTPVTVPATPQAAPPRVAAPPAPPAPAPLVTRSS